MHSRKIAQLSRFAHAPYAAHIHIRCQYRTSQVFFLNCHNSMKLCWNKSKKMPSYWDAKCRHVSNCCIATLWLHSKDYRGFTETIHVTGDIWYSSTDCQKSVETKRSIYSCVPTILRSNSHFRRADWDFIWFSDECRFNLSYAKGRERVYRRRGERFAHA